MSAEHFQGFDPELPNFLAELRQKNADKDWLKRYHETYDALCIKPSLAFITSIKHRLTGITPSHFAEADIGRSLRNCNASAAGSSAAHVSFLHLVFWAGAEPIVSPSLHLVLSAGGMGIGAGQGQFSQKQVARYLNALLDEKKLQQLLDAIASAKDTGCHLERPQMKTPPEGVFSSVQAKQLARHKGLIVRNRNENHNAELFSSGCIDMVLKRFSSLLPLQDWLMKHVYETH